MLWRIAMALCLTLGAIAPAAKACVIMPPEPQRAGETSRAYRARLAALDRERAATYFRERQADALGEAALIFIARETLYPWRALVDRHGRPVLQVVPYNPPRFYRPVAWYRGAPVVAPFPIRTDMTSCGPTSLGDTFGSRFGATLVFFARGLPLNEDNLIDAIAADRITDPALAAFVSSHRR